MQTYSKAYIHRCRFVGNEASNSGGVIYNTRRSFANISHCYFTSNRAANNGGSLLLHHSRTVIGHSTFKNDTAEYGSGGSIAVENDGNGTVSNSFFHECQSRTGGCIAVNLESTMTVKDSKITQSSSLSNGGAVTVKHHSFLIANNLTVIDSRSIYGGGLSIEEASEAFLHNAHYVNNAASEKGGAISCKQSKVTLDTLLIEHNIVGKNGGGVYLNNCNVTADNVTFTGNIASSGGGIYCRSSHLEIHNCRGNGNNATKTGGMMTASNSTNFIAANLQLKFDDFSNNDIIISNNSTADMVHTKLEMNTNYLLCPITVKRCSNLTMGSLYSVFTNDLQEQCNSSQNITRDKTIPFNFICSDESSITSNISAGNFVVVVCFLSFLLQILVGSIAAPTCKTCCCHRNSVRGNHRLHQAGKAPASESSINGKNEQFCSCINSFTSLKGTLFVYQPRPWPRLIN